MQRRVLTFGPFALDTGDFTLARDEVRTTLQPRTFDVLRYLAENARRIVSREELIEAVWEGTHVTDNTVDQALGKIRRALGDQKKMLRTVPRRGWRLMVTVKQEMRGTAELGDRPELPPRLYGRDEELAAIGALLAGPHQLVTLLGPGGIGKTTLARTAVEDWGEGGRFVDLAPCRTGVDVVAAVADVLGVRLQGGDGPLGEALSYAIGRSGVSLFVLDNVEQVTEAVGPLVALWSAAAPAVRFLATSRHRLGLRNERVLEVGPLTTEFAAELLRARVEELDVAVGHDLPEDAVRAVADAVDRVPLAIELAATRLLTADAEDLAAQLRSTLLAPDRPTHHPDRQSSMEATIGWSWALLQPWARDVAEQLSVFRAPFEPALAEEVLDLSAHAAAPAPLQVLGALRSRSLLSRERGDDGTARLRILDAVRTYAAGALRVRGGARAVQEAHARAVLGRMAPWETFHGPTLPVGIRHRMRPLVPELQAVLDHALGRGDGVSAARAALLIAKHYDALGLREACAEVLERVTEAVDFGDDPLIQRAFVDHAAAQNRVAGAERSLALFHDLLGRVLPELRLMVRLRILQVHQDQGLASARDEARAFLEGVGDDDWLRAAAHYVLVAASVRLAIRGDLVGLAEEGVRLAERTDDETLILSSHNALYEVLRRVANYERAEAVLVNAIELAEAFELPVRVAGMSVNLALIRGEGGNDAGAWEALSRAREVAERLGDRTLDAFIHLQLSTFRGERARDLEGARRHLEQARELFASLGRRHFVAGTWAGQGRVAAMLGAHAEALECVRQAREIAPDDDRAFWRCCLVLAIVALSEGDSAAVRRHVRDGRSGIGDGLPHVLVELLAYDAVACALEGNLGEAVALRDEALALASPQDTGITWVRILLHVVDAACGDPEPARGALQLVEPEPPMEGAWARERLAAWVRALGFTPPSPG